MTVRVAFTMGYLLCSVRAFSTSLSKGALRRHGTPKEVFPVSAHRSFSVSASRLSATKEEKEQVAGTNNLSVNHINGDDKSNGRFDSLLSSVGLTGKLKHVKDLPEIRAVTPNDIFCNREVNMERIKCIGFDMDFTLAQYQQPAFDKLAFDGTKQKLVEKLGYPEEVLDLEYDHTVSCIKSSGCICIFAEML